ncbi:MAG: AAA family ATPase [Bacteroidota bacterium]
MQPNKVVLLLGPRRVGKTVLLKQPTEHFEQPFLLLNGEIEEIQRRLSRRNPCNYLDWFGQTRLILIDKAQNIPDVGKVLKLMVDELPGIKILATGSSALSINLTNASLLTTTFGAPTINKKLTGLKIGRACCMLMK